MALETWLIKVKKTLSHTFDSPPPKTTKSPPAVIIKRSRRLGVLAFEAAAIMPKLTHTWRFLSDSDSNDDRTVANRIRDGSSRLEGVGKIVVSENDDDFLLSLARAELVENLKILSKSVSRFGKCCHDPTLRRFETALDEFADTGRDAHGWTLTAKEMDAKTKKIERYVAATAALYKEMDELNSIQTNLNKLLHKKDHNQQDVSSSQKIIHLQQKLLWQQQEVKYAKEKSLWNTSFDSITSLLAASIFTILSRIKTVFGIDIYPTSLSASATVYPSVPMTKISTHDQHGFFETNSRMLKPSPGTLGASALSLHYANLIIVMEKMIRSPQLVGLDARDDLYSMLPNTVRASLRGRLRGIGFTASDPVLACEWREALGKILGWLSPLAHNMIKWQSERSFEHQNLVPKTNVLLVQTLFYANQAKTEAAITELLVGLNYIWRFEREMNAKALFNNCARFDCIKNSKHTSR